MARVLFDEARAGIAVQQSATSRAGAKEPADRGDFDKAIDAHGRTQTKRRTCGACITRMPMPRVPIQSSGDSKADQAEHHKNIMEQVHVTHQMLQMAVPE